MLAADAALLLRLQRLQARPTTRLLLAVTHAADVGGWLMASGALLASGSTRARQLGRRLGLAASLGAAVAVSLKRLARRGRPVASIPKFSSLVEEPDAFSFPSGHTAVAFSVASAFAGEPVLGPLAAVFATAVGVSRMYLGAHYPLDVAAGAVLGSTMGTAARLLTVEPVQPPPPGRRLREVHAAAPGAPA